MLRDKGATIVYTTHYMEEAEILCDRIIILDKGKIIAEGTKEELKEMTKIEEKITLEIDSLNEEIINEIREFKNVDDVTYDRNNLVVIYKKGKNNINELMDYLKSKKVNYNKIFVERPTLNDVFLELTGKDLRD